MMREEIALLRNRLNALLDRNRYLEAENLQLRNQIQLLKEPPLKIPQSSSLTSISLPKREVLPPEPKKIIDQPRKPKPAPNPSQFQKPQNAKRQDGLNSPLPPPPPPPPPMRGQGGPRKSVQRVPELVELYRVLNRKEGKIDAKTGAMVLPAVGSSREMIGEIENRSAHVLAIKSAVETQGDFINFLAKEVENAACKDIADVESFVKWLDEELSYLVDERAVLKHFTHWPEKKADAMREAACTFRDLKNLETEILSFRDDVRVTTDVALKRMQALQGKLEHCIHNIERVRESTSKKYRDFKIPWEWMLDTGFVGQLKLGSMKLVKAYMSRVVSALKLEQFSDDEELILNGVRLAFRVHQFVGGFDESSRGAFQELKMLVVKSPLLA
ncbi:hypothetical protein LUZ60_013075 [Juncus effusus]|nr:hypothetical protein LUZ60_013075 [Juncus effusus]